MSKKLLRLLALPIALLLSILVAGPEAKAQTYCLPDYTFGCTSSDQITNFVFGSISNNSGTACVTAPLGYSDFTSMSTDLMQGVSYTASITIDAGGAAGVAIWIDYNDNGIFEASEKYNTTATIPASSTGTITVSVPLTAPVGPHRMRARLVWNNAGPTIDPCALHSYGEVEDYMVNIIPAPPCSGTPAAVITSSATNVCPSTSFTLTASPTGLAGLTYQFQSSTDGGISWDALGSSSTTNTYTVSSLSATTQYRVLVTCSGSTGTSTPITVTLNPVTMCYCITGLGGASGNSIDTVSIVGTTLQNASPGTAPGYYTSYPATGSTTASLTQGVTYSIYTGFSAASIASLWIDYNQNGIFETTEHTQLTTNAVTATATFMVPITAVPGQTGMRIRTRGVGNPNGPGDACTNFGSGETEDYLITIVAASACSGTPAAGITSSVTTVCAGIPFTLTATPSGMTGLTYLFEVSTDGGSMWSSLGSGPSPIHTVPSQTIASQYRVTVTCAGGGSDTSTPVAVAQSPGTSCYCTPVYTYDCSSGDLIDGFTLNGEGGTSINHTGTGCTSGNYADYTSMSASLFQGFSYPGVITSTYGGTWQYYRIWIDFNDNGLFENSESLAFGGGIGSATPGNFTLNIPATAPVGPHRMRARLVYNFTDPSIIDPCTIYNWGETHDYTVNIIAPAPCSGVPSAAITSSATGACVGVPFTLTATPSGMTGYSYLFQVSIDGGASWDDLATASASATYTVPSQTITSQYRVIVSCSSPGGGSNTSAPVTVTQNPATACYCIPTTGGAGTYYITNFSTTGGITNIDNPSGSSTTGYQDFHTTASGSAMQGNTVGYTITVAGGGTYGRAIWIDFNQDGVFSPSEQVASSSSYEFSPLTGSFTIPLTATPGNTRMRVLASWTPSDPSNPCLNSGTGEYEDYAYTIVPLPPCTGTPVAGDATASPAIICAGGSTGLQLSGFSTGVSGISIAWESATSATGPFSPVSGATGATYYTGPITATTYFRAKVTCSGSSLFAYSDTVAVTISDPSVVSSTPGSSCTPAPVTLSATPGTGSVINWYSSPTGDTLLATGNSFTTPSLTATTTYYAQAVAEVIDDTVGLTTSTQEWYMNAPAYLTFDVFTDLTLESVEVYPFTGFTGLPTGTITISVENSAGTILGTVTESVTGSLTPVTPVTIDLGIEIPAGTNYKLNISHTDIDGYLVDESPAFPFVLPGALAITGGYVDGTDVFYWGTYNWHVTVGCEGPMVPVVATIGGIPEITAQPLGDTLCVGQPLTLSVAASGAATYQWYGPTGAITGATSATYTIPSAVLTDAGDYSVQVMGAPGCGSATSEVAHYVVGSLGQWMGFTNDWHDGANWCGGLPTATTDALIPASTTIPFEPLIQSGQTGQVKNLSVMSSTLTVEGTLEIYGDATASAGGALDAASGSVALSGSTAQSIGLGFNAAQLHVDGGGQKTLGNDVIVTGTLALNSGVLHLGTTTLTLWPGAGLSGGSAAAYVKTGSAGGLKQQVGSTAVLFPVGNSAYNPATIANNGTADNITVRVRDEVLSGGYSGAPVLAPTYVVNRTWDIEEENLGGSDATLTLQWNDGEQNSSSFDYNHVYIAHYTDGAWQNTCCSDASLAPAALGSGPYTVVSSNIESFSPFTVSSAGGEPLHVSSATQAGFRLTAYPNPAGEVLYVGVEGGQAGGQVSLRDVTGRELMARYVENGRARFELGGLSAGVYFIRYSDGVHTQTVKVNKQ